MSAFKRGFLSALMLLTCAGFVLGPALSASRTSPQETLPHQALLPAVAKQWPLQSSPTPTPTPTWTPTGTATYTPTATPTITETLTPSPTPTCATDTASLTLSATDTTLKVGQVVTVTARLNNEGCTPLGVPLYRLSWETAGTQPVLIALTPLEVLHYLAVAPGEHDEAKFVLQAIGAGQATLRSWVSYEVHLGYPGPAYWSGRSAPPLVIRVEPEE